MFDKVQVFSATLMHKRNDLGEKVTEWIRGKSHLRIVDTVVTQSSDSEFHCVSITIFYRDEQGRAAR